MAVQGFNIAKNKTADIDLWIEFLSAANNSHEWLYMIIDCAQDARIYPALSKSLHARCCLFTEEQISDTVKAVAPFLVKIKTMDEFVRWCIGEGLHRHWMLFFTSADLHVSDLRLHFKRFSLVQAPDGKYYFFRYYDPRVLAVFLAESEQRERVDFFRHCKKVWLPQSLPEGGFQFLQLDVAGTPVVLHNPGQVSKATESA